MCQFCNQIARVLNQIEETFIRPYFCRWVWFQIRYIIEPLGITIDTMPQCVPNLNLELSRQLFRRLFIFCVTQQVGGIPSMQVIERGIFKSEGLDGFLQTFRDANEIHSVHKFLARLNCFFVNKPFPGSISTKQLTVERQITRRLTHFSGMAQKTAALLMRLLCSYINFFNDANETNLEVPLDRVNLRVAFDILPDHIVQKPGYQSLQTQWRRLITSGQRPNPFSWQQIELFQEIAAQVMDGIGPIIRFDNLWFIGHFYHDGQLNFKDGIWLASRDANNCQCRQIVEIIDEPYLSGVELPNICPLQHIGCSQIISLRRRNRQCLHK